MNILPASGALIALAPIKESFHLSHPDNKFSDYLYPTLPGAINGAAVVAIAAVAAATRRVVFAMTGPLCNQQRIPYDTAA